MNEKIKSIKFIATSKDVKLVEKSDKIEGNLRNSRTFIRQRVGSVSDENTDKIFTEKSLLDLLKVLAPNIFVKKGYIYSLVGL